jgi:competence protein ComEC
MVLGTYQATIKVLRSILEQEYYNLSLWYFVSYLCGITTYFSLSFEPLFLSIFIIFVLSLLLIFCERNIFWRFAGRLIIFFTFGMMVGKYRIDNLHSVIIEKPIISQIQGQIESIKPTNYGAQLVLKQVTIHKLKKILTKVRISLPKKYVQEININDEISMVASLYKPQPSILPGGYDFSFYAHLAEIGATGYAMSPPRIIAYNNFSTNSFTYKIKQNIYHRLLNSLGPLKGNFAAAILLGESKAIDRKLMKEMRLGGISHILCVSGLHLSLVAMLIFIASRFLLNLSNYIAYNYDIKFIAAICSFIGSYCYLELSGVQIAATRAFIMTTIFIYAIMSGRSTHSLRSLAIAAFLILLISPEYIFHPSFQLSFIAVLSLNAGYEFYIKNQWVLGESKGIFSSIKFYFASNIYSSFLASIITAPVVINQFYTFPTYSIPMNLVAVPIMSFFIMPLAILSLFLMIFGIEQWCLAIIGFFINIIIESVQFANKLPFSVWYFGYITKESLMIFLFGFFWICLWETKWRLIGILIMLVSFVLMLNAPKPNFIFDIQLNAVGVKNYKNDLEIFANKMPEFKRLYWANWFGQKDATVRPLTADIVSSDNNTLVLNYGLPCVNSDVYINLSYQNKCFGNKLTIDKEFFETSNVILVFCNKNQCRVNIRTDRNFLDKK